MDHIFLLTECDIVKAQLIAKVLDDNGIENFVEEAKTVAEATYGDASRMSKVFVSPDDISKAKALLKQLDDSSGEDLSLCPKCSSENLGKGIITQPPKWIPISILLVAVLMLIIYLFYGALFWIPPIIFAILVIYYFTQRNKKGCRCKDCGHTFSNY